MKKAGEEGRIRRRRWADDVTEEFNSDLYTVREQATDRAKWRLVVQCAVDTYTPIINNPPKKLLLLLMMMMTMMLTKAN